MFGRTGRAQILVESTGDIDQRSHAQRAVGALHGRMIFSRRVSVLARNIADMLPDRGSVLDVGAGSGDIAGAISVFKPSLSIEGVDVLVRPNTAIPVREFDGTTLPFKDQAFEYATLIDVLHHTDDPGALLSEVGRVARHVIIKDHYRDGLFAGSRLRLMDWVGNAPHGVRLPYNYLSRGDWKALWASRHFRVVEVREDLQLYPSPLDWVFGRGLHFIATLASSK